MTVLKQESIGAKKKWNRLYKLKRFVKQEVWSSDKGKKQSEQ